MGKNYNGTQISQSVTVSEVAGATVKDCRNKIFVYDENGKAILATGGTKPFIGVALIEAGINDMFGEESGKVEAGDDIDIQIKDIGSVLAGEAIAKGDEITAGADGTAAKANAGDYVLGIALSKVAKDGYARVQISKYQKNDWKNNDYNPKNYIHYVTFCYILFVLAVGCAWNRFFLYFCK